MILIIQNTIQPFEKQIQGQTLDNKIFISDRKMEQNIE